jgi:signal transduction histidine kinase
MEQTQFLSKIVSYGPHPVVVADVRGVVTYANSSALRTLGLEKDEFIGALFGKFVTRIRDHSSWNAVLANMIKGEHVRVAVELARGDKRYKEHVIVGFSIPDGSGCPEVLVFLLHDQSVDGADAADIARKNLEMAKANAELIRANAEFRRLSDLKSSFLSIASHELKTPLTSIKGYSDILIDSMRDRLDPTVLRMVENINRAANRLHKVVNNILDVTRIEQKRLRLQPEPLDLAAIAQDSIEELSDLHTSRHITFECDFPENMPRHFGDKIRMHQVFVNLFSNAVRYSPDNTRVKVNIRLEDEGKTFHLIVCDQGIGIDKADQKRIFDPFYEVGKTSQHSSTSSRYMSGGTGLGLSIVRGIVECHKGRIWAESTGTSAGKFPGTEFHVLLPVEAAIGKKGEGNDPLLNVMTEDASGPDDTLAIIEKKPKILLIDGDRDSGDAARQVLDSVFDVLVAEDGEAGLLLAFENMPSLIMLESHLKGGLDGARICRILRSQEETRDVPIAFLSARVADEDIEKCFASGADDFIVKPFTKGELVDKIWRLLMKKKEDVMYR